MRAASTPCTVGETCSSVGACSNFDTFDFEIFERLIIQGKAD